MLLGLLLGRLGRPGFGLGAGDKRVTIEHLAVVIVRLRIPGVRLGRLAGMSIHLLCVVALKESPAHRLSPPLVGGGLLRSRLSAMCPG